jgi:hypothetical protein
VNDFARMLNLRTAVIELDGGPIWMLHVRFGSKADMCAAKRHVCFTPNSDRESEIPQKAMSALPPKADIRHSVCGRGAIQKVGTSKPRPLGQPTKIVNIQNIRESEQT